MLERTDPRLLMAAADADWSLIASPAVPVLVIERDLPVDPLEALSAISSTITAAGDLEGIALSLAGLPAALRADILLLAGRFLGLTGSSSLRLRLESVDTDACRRFHADYTDVRLVLTYAGPGTDIRETTDDDAPVHRIAAGQVALFKGRLYPGAPPVLLHRSPPIEGSGNRRVVLVLDTPDRAA
jgi:hypothetical protein